MLKNLTYQHFEYYCLSSVAVSDIIDLKTL